MATWERSSTPEERMMAVDILLQALHDRGALAPLFIAGDKGSVRHLLDELAGEETPARAS